jgi:hypothetical protein
MGQSSYKSWTKWSAGDFLVGKFHSAGTDNFGKPNYKMEVVEASFDDGEIPKAGSLFTLNSSGALTKAMEEVSVGDVVKVIYRGEDVINTGKYKGKKFHSMEVLVADSKGTKNTTSEESDLI